MGKEALNTTQEDLEILYGDLDTMDVEEEPLVEYEENAVDDNMPSETKVIDEVESKATNSDDGNESDSDDEEGNLVISEDSDEEQKDSTENDKLNESAERGAKKAKLDDGEKQVAGFAFRFVNECLDETLDDKVEDEEEELIDETTEKKEDKELTTTSKVKMGSPKRRRSRRSFAVKTYYGTK